MPKHLSEAAERERQDIVALNTGLVDSLTKAGLANVWDVIEREKAQFDRVRFLSLPASTPVDVLLRQHQAILDAVLRRRPAEAEGALRAHLKEVLRITDELAAAHRDLFVADL